MTESAELGARDVIARLQRALNDHNIDAFVACFDAGYESEQPAHPARTFTGSEQVRENWSRIFEAMPDLHADLLSVAIEGETAFAEWRWTANPASDEPFDWRGVTVMGVRDGRIEWGRLYMEPVEQAGPNIDETVQQMTQSQG